MLNASRRPRQEPFGAAALALALVLIVFPLVRDYVWTLHRSGSDALAVVVWLLCLVLVGAPAVASWRTVRLSRSRWRRPYESLVVVACIFLFGVLSLVYLLVLATQSIWTRRCSRRLAGLFPPFFMIKIHPEIATRALARRG